MFTFRDKKSKTGLLIKTHHESKSLEGEIKHEIKEMFIGHHTIFSLVGLAVGGTLMGRTLWGWFVEIIGFPLTFVAGFIIFVMSGFALHSFHDQPDLEEKDDTVEN